MRLIVLVGLQAGLVGCGGDSNGPLMLTEVSTSQVSSRRGGSCNDGLACTKDDGWVGGVCKGTPYSCDDNNVCTADTCDGSGGCTPTPVPGHATRQRLHEQRQLRQRRVRRDTA